MMGMERLAGLIPFSIIAAGIILAILEERFSLKRRR